MSAVVGSRWIVQTVVSCPAATGIGPMLTLIGPPTLPPPPPPPPPPVPPPPDPPVPPPPAPPPPSELLPALWPQPPTTSRSDATSAMRIGSSLPLIVGCPTSRVGASESCSRVGTCAGSTSSFLCGDSRAFVQVRSRMRPSGSLLEQLLLDLAERLGAQRIGPDEAVGQHNEPGAGRRIEVHVRAHARVAAAVADELAHPERRELPRQPLLRRGLLFAHLLDGGAAEDLRAAKLAELDERHEKAGQLIRARAQPAGGIVRIAEVAFGGVAAVAVGVVGHGDVRAVEICEP